jgi:putative aldouronate transport system permease protein
MYGLNIAFKKNIIKNEWVGLYNFIKFLSDPYFYKLLRNTLLLNVYSLAFSFPAPIALALMFNELKNLRFKRVIQSITYLPHFISTVVVCGMVVNFLSNDGFVNQVLASLGFERIQFLMQPGFFRPIYIISGIWQNVGWSSIIYLAAISGVDEELYEAATIDGAGRLRKVLSITLPCIAPTVSIMLIMAIGGIMSVGAEKVLLLYNGATYETADVISTFVYRRGMQGADYSYASAVGMFQSVVGLLFLYAANRFSAKISGSSLW